MPTLTRPQLVLKTIDEQSLAYETIVVTKVATMTQGSLLKADRTLAVAGDLAAAIVYIIDDTTVDDAATNAVVTVRVITEPAMSLTIFRASELKLANVKLTPTHLTTFGKKTQ